MSGMTPLGSTTEEQFEDLVRINFTSVFFTVQGALPLLRNGASIVLTGSITSVIGAPSNAAYAGSKAAVRAMARVFAAELSPRKIRVNVVTPGFTRTPLWERSRTPQQVAATSARLPQVVPLGRWSEADEIARAVLSSSRAKTLPTFRAPKSWSTAALPACPAARPHSAARFDRITWEANCYNPYIYDELSATE